MRKIKLKHILTVVLFFFSLQLVKLGLILWSAHLILSGMNTHLSLLNQMIVGIGGYILITAIQANIELSNYHD